MSRSSHQMPWPTSWADAVFNQTSQWGYEEMPETLERGRLVNQFAVCYSASAKDYAEDKKVVAPDLEDLRVLEILGADEPVPVVVEQWLLPRNGSSRLGLVVMEFAPGLRVGVLTGPYCKDPNRGPKVTVEASIKRAHLMDSKRLPVLRFTPDAASSPMKPEVRQDRVDVWLTGLLEDLVGGWLGQVRSVRRGEAEAQAAVRRADKVAMVTQQYRDVFVERDLCVFPLVEMGWQSSGRTKSYGPSSWYNDDHGWSLEADETLGHPDVTCSKGSIQVEFIDEFGDRAYVQDSFFPDDVTSEVPGLAAMSLCGAPADGEATDMCALHEWLPYEGDVSDQAWAHNRRAVAARRIAISHVSAAWRSR